MGTGLRAGLKVLRLAFAAGLLWRRWRGPAARGLVASYLVPTLVSNHGWHGPVAVKFRPREGNEVWLTIDDGPLATCTPGMLDLLEEYGARASFFCVGRRVSACRWLARRMVEAGHKVENHTYSHAAGAWWASPPWVVEREISNGQHAIVTATGVRPRFFRSPVGMNGPWVHGAAAREGLMVVGWSAGGGDGCPEGASARTAERIVREAEPGSILVVHEGLGARRRLGVLRRVLEGLSEKGLRCVIPEVGQLVVL